MDAKKGAEHFAEIITRLYRDKLEAGWGGGWPPIFRIAG
jgi:hypothetical protein